ncbi:hypothetical protein [Verrucomicrobium spinosum]|uniref:hypothetical protein n=2 Tax=Verrucomicrobium spinosum TaxID=2736 RepID=UPI00017466A1|nr:hypothetical protein [Verrucomicrobium spinosum]
MLEITIKIDDTVTQALKFLLGDLTDLKPLNKRIADAAEVVTREHILFRAAPTRHTTADRLGAQPTGYLIRRGNAIESASNAEGATVTLGGAPEIFARVEGPVTIKPVNSKYLTIPASAQAYGRRARELQGLKPIRLGRHLALVEESDSGRPIKGDKSGRKIVVHYWLKESVTLPQDRGLLPSEEQYTVAAEGAAADMLREDLAQLQS